MQTTWCKVCFKKIKPSLFHDLLVSSSICSNCLRDLRPKWIDFELDGVKCLAIYKYEEKIKSLIYQYKGCGDYELKDVFFRPFKRELSLMYKGYLGIIVPSSKGHIEKRGFDHLKEMALGIGVKLVSPFRKNKEHKQSDLNQIERREIKKIIEFCGDFDFRNRKILIIDDICSTGWTLRACIDLLKKQHPKMIKVLVLARREL